MRDCAFYYIQTSRASSRFQIVYFVQLVRIIYFKDLRMGNEKIQRFDWLILFRLAVFQVAPVGFSLLL